MSLLLNARQVLRMARYAPVQFAVILLTLAVGIGANSAMFSIIDAVLLKPLLYPEPDQVVTLTLLGNDGVPNNPISFPDYDDWTRQAQSFASITATRAINFSFLQGDAPERVRGMRATPNLLTTLGVRPEIGRGFQPDEGIPGNGSVAMLSYEFWQSHFRGTTDVLGKPILLGRVPYTVVGVLPPLALPQAAVGTQVPQIIVPFRRCRTNRPVDCFSCASLHG